MLHVVPRQSREPVLVNPGADVGGKHETVPVDHRVNRDRGPEAGGVADDPAGKHAAATSPRDVKLFRIDVATFEDCIHTGVEIREIVAWISVVDEVTELAAIAGA